MNSNYDAVTAELVRRVTALERAARERAGVELGNGTLYLNVVTKSADYTATTSDYLIVVTTGAANKTITLPPAATSAKLVLEVKKIDAGAGSVIIDGNGAETIDGFASLTIGGQYQAITVLCDGTGWYAI